MIYKVLNNIRKIYWKIFKPTTLGVKIIVVIEEKILLVKTSYNNTWNLPGGGVKKGETSLEAARRELKEECGIIKSDLQLLGLYTNFLEGKNDHIALFFTYAKDFNNIKSLEIKENKTFNFDNLPNIAPGAKRRIEEYKCGKFSNGKW